MDITPIIPAGRQVIDGYGPGRFRVAGVVWTGSVLVMPERTVAWPITSLSEVSVTTLAPLFSGGVVVADLLLIGSGRVFQPLPRDLRVAVRAAGLVAEAMDTGAACRTYNVLLSEGRKVAAAMIAT